MWDEPFDQEGIERDSDREERVLVVIVPCTRDWERLRSEHWYRIPVRRAPSVVQADYLAFYHTSTFPDLRWTITYYAPIREYRVVRRIDLLPEESDHPRAKDAYYRVDVGALQALRRPIVSAKLRRVTFIATTMKRLLGAREINDLWDRETSKDRLRQMLSMREVPGAESIDEQSLVPKDDEHYCL